MGSDRQEGADLLQERYRNPWKQAVVCILLNRTHRRQVRPILPELFRDEQFHGHSSRNLNGREARWRREVFEEFGLVKNWTRNRWYWKWDDRAVELEAA